MSAMHNIGLAKNHTNMSQANYAKEMATAGVDASFAFGYSFESLPNYGTLASSGESTLEAGNMILSVETGTAATAAMTLMTFAHFDGILILDSNTGEFSVRY